MGYWPVTQSDGNQFSEGGSSSYIALCELKNGKNSGENDLWKNLKFSPVSLLIHKNFQKMLILALFSKKKKKQFSFPKNCTFFRILIHCIAASANNRGRRQPITFPNGLIMLLHTSTAIREWTHIGNTFNLIAHRKF